MKKLLFAALVSLSVTALHAVEWRGLGEESYYAGPKITSADLAGKVVLVDMWGYMCPPCKALLPRMEQLWQSFKSKPFMLLGAHCQGRKPEEVLALVKANKLTYPIYERAGLAVDEPSCKGAIPFLYVVNHRGKVVYSGRSDREATEAVVNALGQIGGPASLLGTVTLAKKSPYKSLEKQLVLGKPLANVIKKLQGDIKRASAKAASPAQKASAEDAEKILAAIDEAKGEIKEEISYQKSADPETALKLIKAFQVSFPSEAADYKDDLAELTATVKELAAKKAKK